MPLVSKSFSDIITFTRASTATFFDSAGVLQSAANDVPRFDYNPATLAAQGLLIEESRTNLLTYSEAFDTTPDWGFTGSSITPDAVVAPSGATTGDKLVEDSATSLHYTDQTATTSTSSVFTFSVFAKKGERDIFELRIADIGFSSGSRAYATFDLTNVVTLSSGITASDISSAIADIGNGWYRCSLTATLSVSGTTTVAYISLRTSTSLLSGGQSYLGDGTSGLFLWGAQLEAGAFPTSYIPTTTTALTRAADVASVNTLSPWFNAAEGTLYVEASPQASNVGGFNLAELSTDINNRIGLYKLTSTGNASLAVLNGGAIQASTNSGAWTATGKLAGAYATNDFASSLNGSVPATDTTGTLPAVTTLTLGRRADGANILNGHLRRITYYPRRLSNAELQAITA